MNDYDLAIVGGGLVGASLAVALHGSGLRVALIEAAAPPLAEAAWDERCIGLNEATRRIFDSLGVWGAMCGDAEAIAATHVSEQGRFGVARFHASEAGLDALGYNTPLRAIHGSLLQRVRDSGAATLLCPARVDDVQVDGEYVHLHGAALDGGLRARLLVAADGARSPIRQRFGIATEAHDYAQTAIVSSVRTQREHAGIAHERFTPDGPIAVLPRPGRVCTVVWTVPTDVAERLLALSEAAFLQALQAAFGHRLGQFSALGRRGAHPLMRVLSTRLVAERTVFVGNAAQTLHPVVAQGFNLGLRDVATLADLLPDYSDPGCAALLHAYADRRRDDRRQAADFTDGLVRLFSNRVPALGELRHLGLSALNLSGPLKRRMLQRSLGFGAYTPAAARDRA